MFDMWMLPFWICFWAYTIGSWVGILRGKDSLHYYRFKGGRYLKRKTWSGRYYWEYAGTADGYEDQAFPLPLVNSGDSHER